MGLDSSKFKHIGMDPQASKIIVRPSMSYWQDAWRRLKNNKGAMFSLALIALFTFFAFIGPLMTSYDYRTNNYTSINQPPSKDHWFGTDELGRDLWARVWVGAKVSLFIGLISALIQATLGIVIGGVAGLFGGKIDMFIMRVVDILIAIPYMIVVIMIMVIMGSGIVPIIVALTITGWVDMARLVRGQILQLKNQEFILAARVLGADKIRLLFKHLIPNTSGVIIVNLTMSIPRAIFSEAFLSFIGIGINPPMTSWGQLSNIGARVMRIAPYQLLIPGLFISLTMLALNILGDGLRDCLDPRMRR